MKNFGMKIEKEWNGYGMQGNAFHCSKEMQAKKYFENAMVKGVKVYANHLGLILWSWAYLLFKSSWYTWKAVEDWRILQPQVSTTEFSNMNLGLKSPGIRIQPWMSFDLNDLKIFPKLH